MIYCTYLTSYSGNKLPPFYIGHSTIRNIQKGYHGSVVSERYQTIWKTELKNNPELFVTKILTIHDSESDALKKEVYFQTKLNVVSNPLYINQGVWPNIWSGPWNKGKKGLQIPWNKGLTKETDERVAKNAIATSKGCIGRIISQYTRQKLSKTLKDREFTDKHRENLSKSLLGKIKSDSHCENLSASKRGKWSEKQQKAAELRGLRQRGKSTNKGSKWSLEARIRFSIVRTGGKRSEETKQKMSLAAKQRWAVRRVTNS